MKHNKWLKKVIAAVCATMMVCSNLVVSFMAASADSAETLPLAHPMSMHTYGTGTTSTGLWGGLKLFEKIDFENTVDTTKAEFLEFDFFVSNLDNLRKNETERAGLVISLSGGDQQNIWKQRAMYWFQDDLTKTGWNHVKIDLKQAPNGGYNEGETDFTKVFGVMVAISDNCVDETVAVRAANICLTSSTIVAPEKPKNIVASYPFNFTDKNGVDMLMHDAIGSNAGTGWNRFDAAKDHTGAKYIELDLYVSDYEKFSTAKNGNEKAGLYVELFHTTPEKSTGFLAIHDNITNNGWNHVKMPIPKGVDVSKFYGFATGTWEAPNCKYGVANFCLTRDDKIEAPAKPKNIVKELNMPLLEVPSLNAYADFSVSRFDATDLSVAQYFEADVYVDNYAKFSTAKPDGGKVGIYFRPYSSKDTFDVELPLHEQILHDGWNHVKMPIPTDKVDLTKFTGYAIGPWESYDERFAVANVCMTKNAVLEAPAKPENIVKELNMPLLEVPSLNAFTDFSVSRFDATDLSEAQYFEADVYIDDYAKFSTAKPDGGKVGIYFRPYSSKETFDVELSLHEQILHDGWNHVRMAIPTDKVDLTKFTGYAIGPWESYSERFAVANVCMTKDAAKPALPENVTFVVDENGFSNNAWSGELVFKEYGDKTYDLSDSKYFEIDIYISENDFATYQKNVQSIGFSVGSDADKWKNRSIYQGKLNPTKAGWNHFKVMLEDSSYWEGEPDFKAIQKVLIYHEGLHNIDPINLRFVNACFTSGPKEIGPDTNPTEKRPDKNAFYISDCETLIDEFGSWNSAGDFDVDLANRTEGDSSIRMKLNASYNSIRYNCNHGLDLSKADRLKLDFFIANEDVMKSFTKGFMIRLASNGKYRADYAYVELKPEQLKAGWNSLDIAIADLKKEGNADLSNIDTFGLFCVGGSFGEMDELTVKLDNIRISGQVKEADGNVPSDGNSDHESNVPDNQDNTSTGVTSVVWIALLLFVISAAVLFGFVWTRKHAK